MDLTPNIELKDLVRTTRMGSVRTTQFPEIVRDENGTYVGVVTLEGDHVNHPMAAFLLDLIKFGYNHYSQARYSTEQLNEVPDPRALPEESMLGLSTSRNPRSFLGSRDPFFPTLCQGPRGYTQAMPGGTGFDAACMSAINMGQRLVNYDNGVSNLHVDDTPKYLESLKEILDSPDFVKADLGSWAIDEKTSVVRRGIVDYNRKVKFERPPTGIELTQLKEYFSLSACPGFGGVSARGITPTEYVFRTTSDSSD